MSKLLRPGCLILVLALAGAAHAGKKDEYKVKSEALELFKQGEIEYDKGDYEAAIEKFEKCLAKDPTLADAQFNVGICYDELGETDKAITAYLATITLDPHFHEAYFNVGRIYHHREDFLEALAYYEKALADEPYAPDLLYNYAHALMESGSVDKSLEAWDRYLTIAESLPEEAPWVEKARQHVATLQKMKGLDTENE
jgi:tetratricopeptide (TPR) repeat protein